MKTELGDMKYDVELIDTSRHELQGEPKFTNPPITAQRIADNSWAILAGALAKERASKLIDDKILQCVDFSCDTLQDNPKAINASSPRKFPSKNEDNSWAILAMALAKERESELHKNPIRKSRDFYRTENSPGKSIKDASTSSGGVSREIDRCTRKGPVASSQGKKSHEAREFKPSIARDKDKDRKWGREFFRGHEVVNAVPARRKVETESISPRVSPFVASILNSFLRGEVYPLRRSLTATGLSAGNAKSRLLNKWKNEISVHGRCQRTHDSGPEMFLSPAISSPRKADPQEVVNPVPAHGKVKTDSISTRVSPFVASILDSFLRGEDYELGSSTIAVGLSAGNAKSRLLNI